MNTEEQQVFDDFQFNIDEYVKLGRMPGGFLTAVLEDSLSRSINRAASSSIKVLPDLVVYIYNHTPADCWGSKEKVSAWSTHGGLNGK